MSLNSRNLLKMIITGRNNVLSYCPWLDLDHMLRDLQGRHSLKFQWQSKLPKIFKNDDHMMENCEILWEGGGILNAHNEIIIDHIFLFINQCLLILGWYIRISRIIITIRILRIIRIIRTIRMIWIMSIIKIMKIRKWP